jgi:hypothetical protein
MRLAQAPQAGDVPPGSPHGVPDAACALRRLLEFKSSVTAGDPEEPVRVSGPSSAEQRMLPVGAAGPMNADFREFAI